MRLLFMVNGAATDAAAERARAFAARLPRDWQVQIMYRPRRKWAGLLSFTRAALAMRPQVVYVMDVAYTGVLAGSLARRLPGCRMVTDTGDAVAEWSESVGDYTPAQVALKSRIEQVALRRSDAVVVRGSYHKTLLESRGVRCCRFVPDGVDPDCFRPLDGGALRARLGLADSLAVGVVGTLKWSPRHQMCYGWDVVEALGLLPDAPVRALLVGDGNGMDRLQARAAALGVAERVVFAGSAPYEDLPDWIAAMDVCVSTQSNDIVGNVRTTGKLPLYLACGKYVIASDVGEAKRVLPGIGALLPCEGVRDAAYPGRLAGHLREIVADPARRSVAQAARQAAREHFDYRLLAARVEGLCRELAGG